MPINFDCSNEDTGLCEQIAARAVKVLPSAKFVLRDTVMDLMACHCNGTPLDLPKLLAAPVPDFGHDVGGIRRHLNRSTGELEGHFQPRCARPEVIVSPRG
jgi:hypothetical protein